MPTFVTLINYTEDGKELLAEIEPEELFSETRSIIQAHGGEVKDVYFTLGQYDAIGIAEFPDAEAAAKAVMQTGQGVAETETLRAFDEAETRELVAALND